MVSMCSEVGGLQPDTTVRKTLRVTMFGAIITLARLRHPGKLIDYSLFILSEDVDET